MFQESVLQLFKALAKCTRRQTQDGSTCTCAHFRRHQICTQVDATFYRLATQPNSTQVVWRPFVTRSPDFFFDLRLRLNLQIRSATALNDNGSNLKTRVIYKITVWLSTLITITYHISFRYVKPWLNIIHWANKEKLSSVRYQLTWSFCCHYQ